METRAHHVLIGAFTVIVVGLALLVSLWLGKSSVDKEFNQYDVIFNEAVTGLSNGSSVEYSGIRVGDVMRLSLDPDDPRRVYARIRIVSSVPIKEDTRARLALTNITGSAIIQLHGGTPESRALKAAESGGVASIVADPSPIAQLLANGENLMTNINTLVAGANQMFSTANAERVSRSLEHVEVATALLAQQRGNLEDGLQQMLEASREANAALAAAGQLMGTANQMFETDGKAIMSSTRSTLQSLERVSGRLDKVLADNHQALDGGLQGLADLGPAVGELRATLGSLRGMLQRIEENPAGYLLGQEKMQEYAP